MRGCTSECRTRHVSVQDVFAVRRTLKLLALIVLGGDNGGIGSIPVDADVANGWTEAGCWTGAGGGAMLDGVHDVGADCGAFSLPAMESVVTFACMNSEDERKEHLNSSESRSKTIYPKFHGEFAEHFRRDGVF